MTRRMVLHRLRKALTIYGLKPGAFCQVCGGRAPDHTYLCLYTVAANAEVMLLQEAEKGPPMTAPMPDALLTALTRLLNKADEHIGKAMVAGTPVAETRWRGYRAAIDDVLVALAASPGAGTTPPADIRPTVELLRLGERAARWFADGTRTDEELDVETALKCLDGALGVLEGLSTGETPQASDHRLDAVGPTAYRLDGVKPHPHDASLQPSGDEPGRMPETPAFGDNAALVARLRDFAECIEHDAANLANKTNFVYRMMPNTLDGFRDRVALLRDAADALSGAPSTGTT